MDPLLQESYSMDKAAMERCAQHVMLGGGTRGGPVLVRGNRTILCLGIFCPQRFEVIELQGKRGATDA